MRTISNAVLLLALSGILLAQSPAPARQATGSPSSGNVGYAQIMPFPNPLPGPQMQVEYIAAEFGGKLVKGAPYSGEEVTETRQTLADGNRITRNSSARVYRDGQGRTRREQSLEAIGPLGLQSQEPLKTVTITDPASGVTYILDAASRTARKLPAANMLLHSPSVDKPAGAQIIERRVAISGSPGSADATGPAGVRVFIQHAETADANKEALGTQTIEGIVAEGSRVTVTTPAGQIGNELPIQTISESWYSPKLQTVVLSKQSDPRMGETVFRLTKVELGEPPSNLFEVPADYKVIADGNPQLFIKEAPGPTQ